MINDEYQTPPKLFKRLNREFSFDIDAAASDNNHLVDTYFTIKDNGLKQDWNGKVVWVNPPYSRGNIEKWVKKAYFSARRSCAVVVMLIPASTDTAWYHRIVMRANEIRLVRGRIQFYNEEGVPDASSARFPSLIVVFRPFENTRGPVFSSYRWRKVHASQRRKTNVLSD